MVTLVPTFNGRCYYTDLEQELRVLLSSRVVYGDTRKERINKIIHTRRITRNKAYYGDKLLLVWAE